MTETRYIHHDDGTISDTKTGLVWQTESTGSFPWDMAMRYAEVLGNGWRLPTIKELFTLIDFDKYNPASEFPVISVVGYWSSASYMADTLYAWAVDFYDGRVYSNIKTSFYRILLVHG